MRIDDFAITSWRMSQFSCYIWYGSGLACFHGDNFGFNKKIVQRTICNLLIDHFVAARI
ncbi:hypothetical protein NB716_002419 [Pantoea ananatis]|nr:hypothetical protein [Pantoea ananatis]